MNIEDLSSQIDHTCRFCNPQDKKRILFESDDFYVMLSLGPIVEGYLLLVSKRHYECCAAIPENLADEFDRLYFDIKDILERQYGHVIAYEHGRAGSCLVTSESKHCYHAHMHFVPVSFKINEKIHLVFKNDESVTLKDFRQSYRDGKRSYLFADDGTSKMYFPIDPVKRQYLRTLVADFVEKPESWNWLDFQNWPEIESGLVSLQPLFDELKDIKYGS